MTQTTKKLEKKIEKRVVKKVKEAKKNGTRPKRKAKKRAKGSIREVGGQYAFAANPPRRNTGQGPIVNSVPSMPGYASLPPALQFSLSSLRPGLFSTPYVESNNNPSRYPTCVLHGEIEYPQTAAQAANYMIVINDPWTGYSADQGTAGIYCINRADDVTPIPLNMGAGQPFIDIYGGMAVTSKYRVYGQTLDVSIIAPDCTLSGVAYIGAVPRALFSGAGAVVSSLRDYASEVVDLKKNPTYSLKSFINDKTLIHGNKAITDMSEEFVSFAVMARNTVQNITADGARGYTVAVKAHANLLWEPVINSPLMTSLTMRPPDNLRPLTQVEQAFCNSTLAAIPVPNPSDLYEIENHARALTSGKNSQVRIRPRVTHVMPHANSRMLRDPKLDIQSFSEDIGLAKMFQDIISSRKNCSLKESLSDILCDLINDLTKKQTQVLEIKDSYEKSRIRLVSRKDHDEIEYLDIPRKFESDRIPEKADREKIGRDRSENSSFYKA